MKQVFEPLSEYWDQVFHNRSYDTERLSELGSIVDGVRIPFLPFFEKFRKSSGDTFNEIELLAAEFACYKNESDLAIDPRYGQRIFCCDYDIKV